MSDLLPAADELARYQDVIRAVRDQWHGDDRCWMDLETRIFPLLPEGYTPPARDSSVELENCRLFIAAAHGGPTEYISPQKRIEELEAESSKLEHRVKELEVLALWQGGELTEGQAAERLGVDRLSLRGCWISLAGKSSAQPNQPT